MPLSIFVEMKKKLAQEQTRKEREIQKRVVLYVKRGRNQSVHTTCRLRFTSSTEGGLYLKLFLRTSKLIDGLSIYKKN